MPHAARPVDVVEQEVEALKRRLFNLHPGDDAFADLLEQYAVARVEKFAAGTIALMNQQRTF